MNKTFICNPHLDQAVADLTHDLKRLKKRTSESMVIQAALYRFILEVWPNCPHLPKAVESWGLKAPVIVKMARGELS